MKNLPKARFATAALCALLIAPQARAAAPTRAADLPVEQVRRLVQTYKRDSRGPYQGIRWFCPDGSVRPANQPCGEPGGRQHALIRDEVRDLREKHHLFLGQILAAQDSAAFWDEERDNAQLMQYQMEKFLQAIDDGWIMRQARYYRGAVQIEGEERWGRAFLVWLLARDEVLHSQFFLARQAVRDVPHEADNPRTDRIRALAKSVADSLPAFVELRNKIHSQPDSGDVARVAQFRKQQQSNLTPGVSASIEQLLQDMEQAFRVTDLTSLESYAQKLPAASPVTQGLKDLIARRQSAGHGDQYAAVAELLWRIRAQMPQSKGGRERLLLMDLSLRLEEILFRLDATWQPENLGELLDKNYALARAAAGCGFLEVWEWQQIEPLLAPPTVQRSIGLPDFSEKVEHTRRAVAWGTGMVDAVYGPVVGLFAAFEPLAHGFVDDRVRGSVLLPWGAVAGQLAELATRYAGISNYVLGLPAQSQIRGQNPGFALGELEVVSGSGEEVSFSDRKIYALMRAPADLKPVAGIATVSEGNAVSHVQLLARNLGIPNAVLSPALLRDLQPFSASTVFYAASPRGRVVIKRAEEMNEEEKALFSVRQRSEERIAVPVDKLLLDRVELFSLSGVRASASGRLCGPKAANLGQLGALFPGKVAPGLVIPFGVFRRHMEQPMPGGEGSYWQFLQETFRQAAAERAAGRSEAEVEALVLSRLTRLREAIKGMVFLPFFEESLPARFAQVFDAPLGQVAVFVRSDTNMEDLKDFTGAGLNLTVPNVRDAEKIRQAVRDVWASPFTERSYRWRQKYLLNPENVYPSILLLKSVPADRSGVMITAGVSSGDPQDITAAFNRGVGGAVDGQAAETYLLRRDGADVLISPAREKRYALLPLEGGVHRSSTHFHRPVLGPAERAELRRLAAEIRRRLPGAPGIESPGPYDVELGFVEGVSWLFQVRPFVESRRAQSSGYLRGLDPQMPTDLWISLDRSLEAGT